VASILFIGSGGGGGGGGGQDRFAPKYIVGNVPAGDSPVAYSADGFTYFPDPGDGSGIAAALAAVALVGGDVQIRPGTYDFGLGAVVTPLQIPALCQVHGSGVGTTTIIGKNVGDAGVFVLNADILGSGGVSAVRFMRIQGNHGTEGSDALVTLRDNTIMQGCRLDISVSEAGTLRYGIKCVNNGGPPIPPANMQNVVVTCDQAAGQPVASGVLLAENDANVATNVTALALIVASVGAVPLKHSVESIAGTFLCAGFGFIGFGSSALKHTRGVSGAGKCNLAQGTILDITGGQSCVGIELEGQDHTVRSVEIQSYFGSEIGVVARQDNNSVSRVNLIGCTIQGWKTGVRLGSATAGASAISCFVSDCVINARDYGIRAYSDQISSCHFLDNTIGLVPSQQVTPTAGIEIQADSDAFQNAIRGNSVSVTGEQGVGICISSASRDSVIDGNTLKLDGGISAVVLKEGSSGTVCSNNSIESEDALCVLVDVGVVPNRRCVVNGNSCKSIFTLGASPPIQVQSARGIVSNNAVAIQNPNPTPGILLAASSDSNVCIGNVADGSAGVPVDDQGTANEVAHNIGV
jgi:hypothetical protein